VKRGLVIFLAVAAVLSCDRQRRPAELPAGLCELPLAPEGDASASESGLVALSLRSSKQLDVWPLLVLGAGAFQTRCRWCGWGSSRQRGLKTALTAFEVHACEDPSP
jgi:hypothetical protein